MKNTRRRKTIKLNVQRKNTRRKKQYNKCADTKYEKEKNNVLINAKYFVWQGVFLNQLWRNFGLLVYQGYFHGL